MNEYNYVFENEKVYALHAGHVVGAAGTLEELEDHLAGLPGGQLGIPGGQGVGPQGAAVTQCPGCGAEVPENNEVCPHCGTPVPNLGQPQPGQSPQPGLADPMMGGNEGIVHPIASTHIITPGGLKGKVLGRVRDVWGEEVTVRFDNGRIAHLRVADDGQPQGAQFSIEKTAAHESSPIESLQRRVAATFDTDPMSLEARLVELGRVEADASALAAGGLSERDRRELDAIVIEARHARAEVHDVQAHMDSDLATKFQAPAPFAITAGLDNNLRPAGGDWLSDVIEKMAAEEAELDTGKLVAEGAALFASELDDLAVADAGIAREMASRYVQAKIATFADDQATTIHDQFVARVESERRRENRARREVAAKTVKEASASTERDFSEFPDDILFN